MIEFKSLALKNVLSYKEAKISFDGTIKRIFGLNKDATDETGSTGNAVGKSLLFSVITNALYFHSPLSVVKAKTKDIMGERSKLSLTLNSFGTTKKIVQSKSYKLLENGEDLKTRTVPLAKEQIRKWFPLSEEEFFTTTYVSSQRPYLIQQSSDLSRLELLSKLFQLNEYSKLKEVFSQRLRSIKDLKIKASVYKQQLQDKRQKLEETPKTDKTAYSKLESEVDYLGSLLKKTNKEVFETENFLNQLNSVLSIDEQLIKKRKHYKHKGKPKKVLEDLKALKLSWDAYREYKDSIDSVTSDIEDVNKDLNSSKFKDVVSVSEEDIDELKTERTDLKTKLASLKELEDDYIEYISIVKNNHALLKDLGFTLVEAKKLNASDIHESIALATSVLQLKKLLHEKSCVCPTCGSDFDKDKVKSSVKKAETQLEKYRNQLTAHAIVEKWPSKIEDPGKDNPKKILKLEYKIVLLEKAIESKSNNLRLSVEKQMLEKQLKKLATKLDTIDKVKKPDSKFQQEDYDLVKSIVELLKAKHANLELLNVDTNSTIEDIQKLKKKQETKLASLKEEALKIETELSLKSEQFDKLKVGSRTRSQLIADIKEIKDSLDTIKPELRKEKIYNVLVRTYSSKGLKLYVLQNLCGLIQDNFNLYSSYIFNEKFTFSIAVSEKGVSIKVKRPNGLTSDVRNLSGAESNCFILLCQISILPLLPQTRRTNLLILDEPIANCDSITRKKIIDNYFPLLHEVVPNIVFISNTPEEVPESVPFTVIKQDGVSTIVEGNLSAPL